MNLAPMYTNDYRDAAHAPLHPVPLTSSRATIVRQASLAFAERYFRGDEYGFNNLDRLSRQATKAMEELLRDPRMPIPEQDALVAKVHEQLGKLREIFRMFVRDRGAVIWPADARQPQVVQRHWTKAKASYAAFQPDIESLRPVIVANIIICLVAQTRLSLDAYIRKLQGPPPDSDSPKDVEGRSPAAPWLD